MFIYFSNTTHFLNLIVTAAHKIMLGKEDYNCTIASATSDIKIIVFM